MASSATPASFKYILIPADSDDPIKELSLAIPEGQEVECFLDATKDHFRRKGGARTAAQQNAQKEMLMKQLGDAAGQVDPSMLDGALNMQMVENIALLPNSPVFDFVGVNMYCDDQAQLKELPRNVRASAIAECCGKLIEVRGDAFIARVFDNEDDFKRMDFTMQEVSSSAKWVREASAFAKKKLSEGAVPTTTQDFLDRMNRKKLSDAEEGRSRVTVQELTPAEAEKEAGNAAFKKGEWVAAIERYSKAAELDPVMVPIALNNRAMAFLKLGRFSEAEADCTQVLLADSKNTKALLRRGTAREQQGQIEPARADFETVLSLQASNKEAQEAVKRLTPAMADDLPLPPPPPLPEAGSMDVDEPKP